MKKLINISLVVIVAVVVAVALFRSPIAPAWAGMGPWSGATAAPPALYPVGFSPRSSMAGSNVAAAQDSGYLLSNRQGPVADISQVPVEGGWINSQPLNLGTLQKKNKVVLIDFWAYTCINCIRANAFTEELWQRYQDHGLVVIGVHSAEFGVARNPANILAAVKRQDLTYPILTDGHMVVWRQFNNHYWPAAYLISADGKIVYHHFGEGNYAHEEQVVRKQLKKAGYTLPDYGPPDPSMQLVPEFRQQTPELYAGPSRVRRPYGNAKQPQNGVTTPFELPETDLAPDRIYLGGPWHGHKDYVQSKGPGVIALNYQAQAAYVVLGTAGKEHTVTVTLDGEPVPKKFRGKDLYVQDGETVMDVQTPRLYWPINNHAPYGRHTIRFHVPAGVRLYSFTFGTYR